MLSSANTSLNKFLDYVLYIVVMTNENTIAELLEKLNKEIQNPKDSVHKIVLKITIDNINKLLK